MSDAVFCCEKKSKCQWQCFALHQGLGWGRVPKLTENSWREWHDKMCGGKLIQLVPSRLPDTDEADVLRRVAELMSKYIDEEQLQNVSLEDWIDQARRELESEAREGQKGGAE